MASLKLPKMNYEEPQFGKDDFNCPHCQCYSEQIWSNENKLFEKILSVQRVYCFSNTDAFHTPTIDRFITQFKNQNRIKTKVIEFDHDFSRCRSCKKLALWINGEMVYPSVSVVPSPSDEMPPEVCKIYEEARKVYPFSPRASVALLRIALEEILNLQEIPSGKLYKRIELLEKKGLNPRIIKRFTLLRKYGNEGCHIGQIDLSNEDGKEVVDSLFYLLNKIVDEVITDKKKLDDLDAKLNKNK